MPKLSSLFAKSLAYSVCNGTLTLPDVQQYRECLDALSQHSSKSFDCKRHWVEWWRVENDKQHAQAQEMGSACSRLSSLAMRKKAG